MNDNQPVFYQPGKPGIIDLCIDGKGQYSGESLEQMRLRYPGAEIGELGAVSEYSENCFKSAAVEITEDRFIEMLEVLPPINWVHENGSESFKISERTYGNITAIFARIGERYFELSDSIFLSHQQIMEKCEKV
ncbi:MAG: DUF1419 domain-containing protein [Candidatus Brocadiaceae bacterium]|nr:DUF1419 domain-containing protein [Candidatus Brocadiaceae bacterium]